MWSSQNHEDPVRKKGAALIMVPPLDLFGDVGESLVGLDRLWGQR
jgi:hypothetical protein